MLTPPSSLKRLAPEWEEHLFRLEAAWNEAPPQDLRAFCPPDFSLSYVVELLRIDMERRRAAGLPLPLPEYARTFPELNEVALQSLVLAVPAGPLDYEVDESLPEGEADLDQPLKMATVYGNFRLVAQGGLGEVFVAEDAALHRPIAVKLLRGRWRHSRQATAGFLREAELTSRLEHPGVVPVHGIGTLASGRPCYSMRFVEGETLWTALDRFHRQPREDAGQRALALRKLLCHLIAVCNTVAYAHSRGVVHRDLKPENILLGPFGETLVIDWGLAKEFSSNSETASSGNDSSGIQHPRAKDRSPTEETATGELAGTPAYLSPEQAGGEQDVVGPAADVFGLGATLYAVLTGAPPYSTESMALALRQARLAEFIPPRQREGSVPAALDAICRKAMQKVPEDRYASPLGLARDLELWLAGEKVSAWKEPLHVTARRSLRRRPFLAGAMAVAAVLVPLALAVGGWFIASARAERELARRTAEAQRTAAAETALYLVRTFESAEPVGLSPIGFQFGETQLDTTLKRMLVQGEELLATQLHDQPLLRARLLVAIGNTHLTLGEAEEARACLREAHELRRLHLGSRAVETLQSLHWMARLEHDTGFYDEARRLYEEVLREREKLVPPQPLLVADSKFHLGWLMFDQPLGTALPQFNAQTSAAAEKLLLEALRIREWCLPPMHRDLGFTCGVLAMLKACQSNQEDAAAEYRRRAIAIFSHAPDRRYAEYLCKYLQAEEHRKHWRFAQAEAQYEEMLAYLRHQFGPKHSRALLQQANMVGLYRKAYVTEQATARRLHCLARGLALMRELRVLLRDNRLMRSQPLFVNALLQYGDYFRYLEKNETEAVAVYQEALRHARERPQANQASMHALAQRLQETKTTATATAR